MLNLVEDFKCHLKGLCNKNLVPNVDLLGNGGFFFKKNYLYLLCVFVCVCVSMCCVCRCLWKQEEGRSKKRV